MGSFLSGRKDHCTSKCDAAGFSWCLDAKHQSLANEFFGKHGDIINDDGVKDIKAMLISRSIKTPVLKKINIFQT